MQTETTLPLAALLLQHDVSAFYSLEADLLDARQFAEWLELLAEDVRYWMPLNRNVRYGEADQFTRAQMDVNWFDEGRVTLAQRVAQLATGIHWAEEPQSRTSHLVTNVRVLGAVPDASAPAEVTTSTRFLIYRNRLADEVDILVGKRFDTLRRRPGEYRAGEGWLIARRRIELDQNVLLAKNLTTFF